MVSPTLIYAIDTIGIYFLESQYTFGMGQVTENQGQEDLLLLIWVIRPPEQILGILIPTREKRIKLSNPFQY